MTNRRSRVFAEIVAHPGDAFSANDEIGLDHRFDRRNGSDVSTHNNGGARREFAHHPAHLAHLPNVDNDR
jgi:hypothetical protein